MEVSVLLQYMLRGRRATHESSKEILILSFTLF